MTSPAGENREIARKLHKLHFLLAKLARHFLRQELQLGFSQFLVLSSLKRKESFSQHAAAGFLGVTDAAVSRKIDDLRTRGFVTRKDNPDNRREHLLELTDKGREELQKAKKLLDERLGELFQVLSKDDSSTFLRVVDHLTDRICSEHPELFHEFTSLTRSSHVPV